MLLAIDVGADRLVNAVAALRRYAGGPAGVRRPIIAVDFGTGGLASAMAAETTVIEAVEPDLTLIGLRYVWELHRDAKA